MKEKRLAVLFFSIYLLILVLLIVIIAQQNELSFSTIMFAIVWWLLCLPGYILMWATFSGRLK